MTKGAIVAIGGGEILTSSKLAETFLIDKMTVELAVDIHHVPQVRVLFIPTASGDDFSYCCKVYKHFHLLLDCKYDQLRLIAEEYSHEQIAQKINRAHIIYVGGGNTRSMMKVWKETSVDVLLRKAYEKGAVLTGLSAGSICWFDAGLSDSNKLDGHENWEPVWVEGLGIITALHCPHYSSEPWRKDAVAEKVADTDLRVIALDDNCALVIRDGTFTIVSSQNNSYARRITANRSEIILENGWKPLSEL